MDHFGVRVLRTMNRRSAIHVSEIARETASDLETLRGFLKRALDLGLVEMTDPDWYRLLPMGNGKRDDLKQLDLI